MFVPFIITCDRSVEDRCWAERFDMVDDTIECQLVGLAHCSHEKAHFVVVAPSTSMKLANFLPGSGALSAVQDSITSGRNLMREATCGWRLASGGLAGESAADENRTCLDDYAPNRFARADISPRACIFERPTRRGRMLRGTGAS
jgi:hypothetical protein